MKEELIQIRISEEQKQGLEKKANEQGMNKSEAIRYLIQKWIES